MTSYDVPDWEYDVIISFNPNDSSKNFIDHLIKAMDKKGILVYKEIDQGSRATRREAIRISRFAIVVLSVNYASSLTCLDELVEIHNTVGQTVLPVFYNVDPSAVRKQSHSYEKVFEEYAVLFENELDKVSKWRGVLNEVAGRSGWHLLNKSENQCIQEIVEVVFSKLNDSFANATDDLVGINTRVDELVSRLKLRQTREVRTIAICGVPGLGKTTIARSLRDEIFCEFQCSCFLSNVSQVSHKYGIQKLQGQIMSEIFKENVPEVFDALQMAKELNKKLRRKQVLFILDDIDDIKQLQMLAGDEDWFGPGSRIIITATNEDLFRNYRVDEIYRPAELHHDEAFRLLSIKAFNEACPPEEYVELSKQVVSNAKGIPRAIEEIGSLLYGRSLLEWESIVKRLYENP